MKAEVVRCPIPSCRRCCRRCFEYAGSELGSEVAELFQARIDGGWQLSGDSRDAQTRTHVLVLLYLGRTDIDPRPGHGLASERSDLELLGQRTLVNLLHSHFFDQPVPFGLGDVCRDDLLNLRRRGLILCLDPIELFPRSRKLDARLLSGAECEDR